MPQADFRGTTPPWALELAESVVARGKHKDTAHLELAVAKSLERVRRVALMEALAACDGPNFDDWAVAQIENATRDEIRGRIHEIMDRGPAE